MKKTERICEWPYSGQLQGWLPSLPSCIVPVIRQEPATVRQKVEPNYRSIIYTHLQEELMITVMHRSALTLLTMSLAAQFCLPTGAENTTLTGSASKTTVKSSATKRFFQEHPKVKSATIGAGVGTAAGAVTGLISGKGVVRGAAIGAGTGAGVGLIESSSTMKRHPIIKNVAVGTAAGLGLGLAASRGEHKGKRVGQAAGVGAAVGLAAGLLKDRLR